MKDLSVRYANCEDTKYLVTLLAELGYPVSLEDFTVRFKRFIQNPGYGVAVCEIDQRVAGFVAWSRSQLIVSDATRFHIEALAVMSEYRGLGAGTKLMKFVEEIAGQSSPSIVDLTSGQRRAKDGSHEFYKRLGYANEGHMAKLYFRKQF